MRSSRGRRRPPPAAAATKNRAASRASSAADLAAQSNHLLRRASSVSSVGAPSARVSAGVVELDSKLGQQRTAKWLRSVMRTSKNVMRASTHPTLDVLAGLLATGAGETPVDFIESTLKATLSKKLVLVGAKRKALHSLYALVHLDKCDPSEGDQMCFEVADLFSMNHEVLKALFSTVVRSTKQEKRARTEGEDTVEAAKANVHAWLEKCAIPAHTRERVKDFSIKWMTGQKERPSARSKA